MQRSLPIAKGLHVALVPDGNGRWATRRGLPRRAGHLAGLGRVDEIVPAAADAGISILSLFAFSRLNWKRPDPEVTFLMRIFRRFFERAGRECPAQGIRVVGIGGRGRIPAELRESIETAEDATREGDRMLLRVAVDYSSREVIRAAAAGIRALPAVPDVDLLIRTGGEQRLSDFLLYEIAQAELIFLSDLWPDFDAADLRSSLAAYHHRERRLGAVGKAV